ncbi:AAA family ATPase [Foetidibacter luteolus]|uniref:AAA family ATPase n=1 Tax=Foetidibacter luteolus TaxID=2608880 RepID=UPI00129A64DC|nr:AAA family ATPase [Foetidibacter luteolus]
MINHINPLIIKNYKSIKKLELSCNRINVLIGEPNSGKSNILEALDVSYLSWMLGANETNRKEGRELIDIQKFFRVQSASDLFHLGNLQHSIEILHPGFSINTYLKYNAEEDKNYFEWSTSNGSETLFQKDFSVVDPMQFFASPIKPFRYQSNIEFHDSGNYFYNLMPPFGNNLAKVIYHNADMVSLAKTFAKENGFEFNLDKSTETINIQLRLGDGLVYTLSYEALADTFKRMLFYIAAVRHNNASVITLDEPDTHAFPPYVSFLADEIIKNNNSQFFIATHNPYLLNTLIENTPAGDLGVFVCSYDNNARSTQAKKLTDSDLSELLDYGVDIFFNLNKYLDDSFEYRT